MVEKAHSLEVRPGLEFCSTLGQLHFSGELLLLAELPFPKIRSQIQVVGGRSEVGTQFCQITGLIFHMTPS